MRISFPLDLLSDPRRRILTLLRAGERTVPELAAALSVSGNAVRGHLAALGRDGLVTGGPLRPRDGPGKPATPYRLTPAAEELFPRGYGVLLMEILDLLCAWDGADAPAEVMRAAGARTARGEGAGEAARVLAGLGADVVLAPAAEGTILSTSGCPLAAGVLDRPELCGWVAALLAGACGGPATAACDRSGGRPRCRFTLAESAAS